MGSRARHLRREVVGQQRQAEQRLEARTLAVARRSRVVAQAETRAVELVLTRELAGAGPQAAVPPVVARTAVERVAPAAASVARAFPVPMVTTARRPAARFPFCRPKRSFRRV